MKSIIIIFFLITAITSCTDSKKEKEVQAGTNDTISTLPVTAPTATAASDTLAEWIGAYQKMDENYTEEKDTMVINNWWRQKLAQVERYRQPDNLFTSNGGGPHGSEWNPLNDLYIVITTAQQVTGENATLALNGKQVSSVKMIKVKPASKTGTIWYGILPHDTWTKALRPTTKEDLTFMYGKEKADSMGKQHSGAPVTESVAITVKINAPGKQPIIQKGIFLAAFGE